jgi:hypothetical protein
MQNEKQNKNAEYTHKENKNVLCLLHLAEAL